MPNSMAGKTSESVTCHIMQIALNLNYRDFCGGENLAKSNLEKHDVCHVWNGCDRHV